MRGRRYTDPAALAVVRESLVAVGAEVSAALGPAALQLVGDEIGLEAAPVPELGLVGEPLPCRPREVESALAEGRIPVVTPIAVGPLNVNADEAATALAVGLGADRVIFVSCSRRAERREHLGATRCWIARRPARGFRADDEAE